MNVLVDIALIVGILYILVLASMNSTNVDELLHTQSDPYKTDIPDFPPQEWTR